jgi:putative ABC transport system permease protein
MSGLVQDLRYAARGLARTPGFALLAIVCLAIGIGVNSTVFSVADTVLLRPLPFSEPERLVALYSTQLSNGLDQNNVSYADYRDWTDQVRSYAEIAAQGRRSLSLTEGGVSERFLGSLVTWNLFPMLGVHPVLGRQFTPDDDRPGAAPVVILSHGVWQRRYAGDPAILGRPIVVNGTAHTVIGVMPPKFQFPQLAQLWLPLVPLEHAVPRGVRGINPYARLAAGATAESASRELSGIAAGLERLHREDQGWSARVAALRDDLMPEEVRISSVAMFGAVAMVLTIACANVANLLLARATGRAREIAIRAAIGAGRGRLVRQLLTESVLLGLLAAPLGILIGYAGIRGIDAATPPGAIIPYYIDWSMNGRVLAYTIAISVMTGLIFGLVPALQAARPDLYHTLKDGARGSGGSRGRNRLRQLLVVVEVALSLVLLVGASLFVRSYLNIANADAGIDTSRLMTMRMFMADERYASPETRVQRVEDVIRRIEAIPGVQSAFISNLVPHAAGGATAPIVIEGVDVEAGKEPQVFFFGSTAHALETLDQRLVAGRALTEAEAMTRSGVVIVNHSFARRFWPTHTDYIGRRFRFLSEPADQWLTVVGVAYDFNPIQLRSAAAAPPLAIVPYPYQATRDNGIVMRVGGGTPAAVTAPAREAVAASDTTLAIYDPRSGESNREIRAWGPSIMSKMFSMFGAAALFLAVVGIYGVLSYSVAQRTQEFGVRVALGAPRYRILSLVLGDGMRLAAIGIAIGGLGALGMTRLVRTILYNVNEPASFITTALVLVAVTVLAGLVPARRATSIDPMVALRAE